MNNDDEGRHMNSGNDEKGIQKITSTDRLKGGPVETVMRAVKEAGVDLVLHLPCGHIRPLLNPLVKEIRNIPLTREEEGVGIAAGASLAGSKPLMIIQSGGIGNMINALLSLTQYYELPLPIFVSHRGLDDEIIEAQKPLGSKLIPMLDALGIEHHSYLEMDDIVDSNRFVQTDDPNETNDCTENDCPNDSKKSINTENPGSIKELLLHSYEKNKIVVFLFSPKIWEGFGTGDMILPGIPSVHREKIIRGIQKPISRLGAIKKLKTFLMGKAVVCNMGYPSRELYHVFQQTSNFYMLGSLGLASSIGLGLAISSSHDVVVLDGDGSILMNPNALVSIGGVRPENLTIITLDNGSYGSTGNQPTHAGRGLPLEELAIASGIPRILVTDNPGDVERFGNRKGPWFIRLKVKPGNASVSTINLSGKEIKESLIEWLSGRRGPNDRDQHF